MKAGKEMVFRTSQRFTSSEKHVGMTKDKFCSKLNHLLKCRLENSFLNYRWEKQLCSLKATGIAPLSKELELNGRRRNAPVPLRR
jgi:hypothetical protein